MACPAESRTLDEFESCSATYNARESSVLRKRLKEIGIRIYEAVSLGKSSKEEKYKTKIELEKILGTNITGSAYVDSAWGCKCECQGHCKCQNVEYEVPSDGSTGVCPSYDPDTRPEPKCFKDNIRCNAEGWCQDR